MSNRTNHINPASYAFLWLSDLFLTLGASAIAFGFSALFLAGGESNVLSSAGVLTFGVSSVVIGIVMLPASAIFKVLAITRIESGRGD